MLACTGAARAQAPVVVSPELRGQPLGSHIAVLEDESCALTIDDVSRGPRSREFAPTPFDAPAYGFRKSVFWVRFRAANPSVEARHWLLELAYPHLDYVDLFVPTPGGGFTVKSTGDHRPFASRDLDYRNFVFSLTEPPHGEATYYLRLRTSGSMNVPLVAWAPLAFFDNQNREQPVLWMFYGLMLVMACYNAFIFFAVRERDYLYYSLYIVSYFLFSFTLNGHTFQYLLPNQIWLANQLLPFAIGASFLWSAQFLRAYLSLSSSMPRMDPWVRGGVYMSAALALFGLVGPYELSIRVLVLVNTTLTAAMVAAAAVLVGRGYRPAKLYLLAWGFFLFGILLYFFKTMGILPNHFVTNWSLQIGASLEVILLSLALADRINIMRSDLSGLNQQLSRNVADLRAALTRAEAATRAKSDFLATVSHELRTPLNAIINIPQGLMRDFPEFDGATCGACRSLFALDPGEVVPDAAPCPECGEPALRAERITRYQGRPEHTVHHLRIIERSGRHLLQVVNGILDFSRLDAGRLELKLEWVEVHALLDEVVEPLEESARRKGLTLEVQRLDAPVRLRCDPLRVSQVLINLLGNAIKFSEPPGVVRIRVDGDGQYVVFRVSDQGIGIPAEYREKIFESFEQVDRGDTRKYGGTGLGLSISRTLVRMHGGEIWVESEVGRGSTFSVRIPIDTSAGHAGARLDPATPTGPIALPSSQEFSA